LAHFLEKCDEAVKCKEINNFPNIFDKQCKLRDIIVFWSKKLIRTFFWLGTGIPVAADFLFSSDS